jgi:hypothetical protein
MMGDIIVGSSGVWLTRDASHSSVIVYKPVNRVATKRIRSSMAQLSFQGMAGPPSP